MKAAEGPIQENFFPIGELHENSRRMPRSEQRARVILAGPSQCSRDHANSWRALRAALDSFLSGYAYRI